MSEQPKWRATDADAPDEFLRELEQLAAAEQLDTEQLLAALAPADADADADATQPDAHDAPAGAAHALELRARLMAALPHTSRFERFADAVAQLLDIERARALRLLDQLDRRDLYNELMPGIELLWVQGGPRVADAVRGFVHVAAGVDFPEHEHFGLEHVLVLQGSFIDPSRNLTFRPGDIDTMPAGTSHLHIVPADGPDLLVLSVIQKGVAVGGQHFLPNQFPAQHD